MKIVRSIFIIMCVAVTSLTAAELSTNKTTYTAGETVTVTFSGGMTVKDWVGMYNSTTTPAESDSLGWFYLDGGTKVVPQFTVTSGKLEFTAPTNAGDYKFCFHSNGGYTVDAYANISVQKKIIQAPRFTSTMTSLLEGSSTHFIDLSQNDPTAWAWTFDGGTPSTSSNQNPTVKYVKSGTYNVTLTTTNAAGNHTSTKTGYITVAKEGEATHLKCLQFNIWQEGTSVPNGFSYIRDVVAAVNPDVVSFVEVRNYSGDWTTKMVNALAGLGLTYHRGYAGGDTSIISKFPIKSSTQVSKTVVCHIDVYGTEVLVASAHLDYTRYACYLPRGFRDGGSAPDYNGYGALTGGKITDTATIHSQNLASTRDEEIAAFINYVKDEKRPTILLGDFNEPSCLDWTVNQANMFDHNGVAYQWDTTLSLANNNFTDTYRKIHPDEVANPGLSWPAIAEGVANIGWINADERDRIDYIFYRGSGVSVTDVAVVGPQACYINKVKSLANTENDKFLVPDLPWPSDHKGVWANVLIPSAVKKKVTVPSNDAIDISPNSNLTLSFKMSVVPVAGKFIKIRTADGVLVENINVATLGASAQSFVIDPTNELLYNTTYSVEVDAGAFKTAAGVESEELLATDWTFTTKELVTEVKVNLSGTELSWVTDSEDGIVRYEVRMKQGDNWVLFTTVVANKKADSNYNVTVPEATAAYKVDAIDSSGFIQSFVPTASSKSTTIIELTKGWNLISTPCNNANFSPTEKTFWAWDGHTYLVVTKAKVCQGLWVYSEGVELLTITGEKVTGGNVKLNAGWNLVGPVANCSPPSGFQIYNWKDETYSGVDREDTLIAGEGYWFFSNSATSTILK